MENLLKDSIIQLLLIIIGGALSIFSVYVGLYVAKINQKAKIEIAKLDDEKMQAVLENSLARVDMLIKTNVIAMENTLKVELTKAILDGKVDKEELKTLSVAVKENVLNQLTDNTLDVLNGGIKDLSQYVEVRIEEQLAVLKQQIK